MEIKVSCIYSDQMETRISQVPFYSGSIGLEIWKSAGCRFIVLGLHIQWCCVPGVMQNEGKENFLEFSTGSVLLLDLTRVMQMAFFLC